MMISSIKIVAPDASEWLIMVSDVALHKAKTISKETKEEPLYVLAKTVFPEFEKNSAAIIEWAKNRMLPTEIRLLKKKDPLPMAKEDVLKKGVWSPS